MAMADRKDGHKHCGLCSIFALRVFHIAHVAAKAESMTAQFSEHGATSSVMC